MGGRVGKNQTGKECRRGREVVRFGEEELGKGILLGHTREWFMLRDRGMMFVWVQGH